MKVVKGSRRVSRWSSGGARCRGSRSARKRVERCDLLKDKKDVSEWPGVLGREVCGSKDRPSPGRETGNRTQSVETKDQSEDRDRAERRLCHKETWAARDCPKDERSHRGEAFTAHRGPTARDRGPVTCRSVVKDRPLPKGTGNKDSGQEVAKQTHV